MTHPATLYRDAKMAQEQAERHGHAATAAALAGIATMIAALEAKAHGAQTLAGHTPSFRGRS